MKMILGPWVEDPAISCLVWSLESWRALLLARPALSRPHVYDVGRVSVLLMLPQQVPAGVYYLVQTSWRGQAVFLSSLALVPVLGKPCAVHLEGGVFSAFLPSPLVRKDGESSARVSFLPPSPPPQQRGFASLQKYKILTIEHSSSATVEGRLCFLWEKSMDFMPLLQQLLLQVSFSWSYSFSYAPSTDLY